MNKRRLIVSSVFVLVVAVIQVLWTAHAHDPHVIFRDRLDAVLPGCIDASNIGVTESGGVLILRFEALRKECLNELIKSVLPVSHYPAPGVSREDLAYFSRLMRKDKQFQKVVSQEKPLKIATTRSGLHLVYTQILVGGDDSVWIILIEED